MPVEGLDRGHVGFVVDREDLLARGGWRRQCVDGISQRGQKVHQDREAGWGEGVVRAEIVACVLPAVNYRSHGFCMGQRTPK